MAWPNNMEYFEAVQNPQTSFQDVELRQGKVVCTVMGTPKADGGNFAQVYQIVSPAKKSWAIKCFTREIPGLQARYHHISACLQKANLPFTVDFQYLDQGICIKGQWYPLLKMRWVEGEPLNLFIQRHIDKPKLLQGLVDLWSKMAQQLRLNQIAHADLQHGNVLLVPQAKDLVRLTLIDYDGMIVPSLADKPSGELGHSNYQHPQRMQESTYSPAVDLFSHLVICCGLRCLAVGGRDLWQRYDNEDNLLFRQRDFENPFGSALFRELWCLPDPMAHALVGRLVIACQERLEQLPPVEILLGKTLPISLEKQVQRIFLKNGNTKKDLAKGAVSLSQTGVSSSDPWWVSTKAMLENPLKTTKTASTCTPTVNTGSARSHVNIAGGLKIWQRQLLYYGLPGTILFFLLIIHDFILLNRQKSELPSGPEIQDIASLQPKKEKPPAKKVDLPKKDEPPSKQDPTKKDKEKEVKPKNEETEPKKKETPPLPTGKMEKRIEDSFFVNCDLRDNLMDYLLFDKNMFKRDERPDHQAIYFFPGNGGGYTIFRFKTPFAIESASFFSRVWIVNNHGQVTISVSKDNSDYHMVSKTSINDPIDISKFVKGGKTVYMKINMDGNCQLARTDPRPSGISDTQVPNVFQFFASPIEGKIGPGLISGKDFNKLRSYKLGGEKTGGTE